MKWIVLFSLIVFSVSCSNDTKDILLSNASLNVEINAADLNNTGGLKAGVYKRGNAPVYIKGVEITAINTEYDVDDVKETFLFASDNADEGEDIVLSGLTVGANSITAKGLARYSAKNAHYWNIPGMSGNNLDDDADACAKYLRGIHPIYAQYYSKIPVEKVISNGGNNEITVDMVTDNHRAAFVFHNASSKYHIVVYVRVAGKIMAAASVSRGGSVSYVYNDKNAKGNKTYDITIDYYTKNSYEKMGGFVRHETVSSYDNVTKLFRFSKDELHEGKSLSKFTWKKLNVKNSGEDIE